MSYTHRQQREAFHLLFLARLLKISDPRLFVLKGGVNLRFFYNSPRYSEDMDLDVLGGAVQTLQKNGYRILEDAALRRALATFGIAELIVNDPGKAKHTETTQRFRAQLVTDAGEHLPTKVEFSRRDVTDAYETRTISPSVARPYRQLAFACQHFTGESAVRQKISALAHRGQVQARDVFDLYVLWLGGQTESFDVTTISAEDRTLARENLASLDYPDYEGQVLDYLEPEARDQYSGPDFWHQASERVLEILGD